MSKYEDGSYGSLTGVALIGKILAGRCTMKYTRAAVGKGTIPDDMTPKTMTDCADYVMEARIASVTNPVDGECQVTVQIKSDDVETGFYLTNIVLFAEDPDVGEVAYTYLSLENEPEWIRPASSIVGKLATFDIIAAVGDIDAVEAIIDPEAIATVGQVQQMIEEHNEDPNAHGGIGSVVLTSTSIPVSEWVQDDENGFYNDVSIDSVTEDLYVSVTIHKESLDAARAAGLCPTIQVTEGVIRFWSEEVPAEDLTVTVALFSQSAGIVSSGNYVPIATSTTVGGVKVREGSGLNVDSEGNLSLDTATTQDIVSVFSSSE